jgi:thiol-disulfide isomerase/thioredoxin
MEHRKGIFLIIGLLFAMITHAQTVLTTEQVMTPIYSRAKAENKNVLLIYHASWCGWCRKMDASLLDKSVRSLIDRNYVTAHLTVQETPDKKALENPGAQLLYEKHGGQVTKSLPYWLVLDKDGNVLANSQYVPGKNSGCPASEEEVKYFITVLSKTSTLTAEELGVVAKRFRQNETK